MFRSRYPFEAKFPQSISFAANDTLLGLRKENDHWLYVYHEDGRLGAVPLNYVEEKISKERDEVLRLVDSALGKISDKELFDKGSILNYLQKLKENPLNISLMPTRKKAQLPPPVDKRVKTDLERKEGVNHCHGGEKLPLGLSFIMLDKIRSSTNANYERCLSGFTKLLNILGEHSPQFTNLTEQLISELMDPNPTIKRATYSSLSDWPNLQQHIATLERRAKDQQESSWPLSEDDMAIVNDLDSFAELLCNASVDMVRTCLADDKLPLALSFLYQREKRKLIRRFYLLVLVATCHIQPAILTVYLDSCLPMEVIRELSSSRLDELDLILDLRVLTVLLAKSSSLPVNIRNALDESFFDYVFQRVSGFSDEVPKDMPSDFISFSEDTTPVKAMGDLSIGAWGSFALNGDKASTGDKPSPLLRETFVQFVCAANRHFCVPDLTESAPLTPIMAAIVKTQSASTNLLERLFEIFNRGGDPLTLNGVSFVRQLRGNLHEGFDISDSLYNGAALYAEGPIGSSATSRRASLCFDDDDDSAAHSDVDEVFEVRPSRRSCLTDVTLQAAPDTPRNAARKLLTDVFSCHSASLVYQNDIHVLVDVIIRQLHDLPVNSPDLCEYIFCISKIVRFSQHTKRPLDREQTDGLVAGLRVVEQAAGSPPVNGGDFSTSRCQRLAADLLRTLSSDQTAVQT